MTSKDKIITIKKKVLFFIVTFLTVFVFLEIVLNLFVLVSPRIDRLLAPPWADSSVPRFFPDEVLGYRPNPAFPEHDTNGFRNPKVPTKADVVALGDSQTYGTGVNPEEAWPKQLEPMIAKTVYSMAFGGYGPVHSLIFLDEAFALKPKIIIEAFYAGNDLFDSFNIVYNLGQFNELKSHDPQVQNRVRETEKGEPIKEYVLKCLRWGIWTILPIIQNYQ